MTVDYGDEVFRVPSIETERQRLIHLAIRRLAERYERLCRGAELPRADAFALREWFESRLLELQRIYLEDLDRPPLRKLHWVFIGGALLTRDRLKLPRIKKLPPR